MEGKELRRIREKYGYTQVEFAKVLGISRGTVINYENALKIPSHKVPGLKATLRKLRSLNVEDEKAESHTLLKGMRVSNIVAYVVENQEDFLKDLLFVEFVEKLCLKKVVTILRSDL